MFILSKSHLLNNVHKQLGHATSKSKFFIFTKNFLSKYDINNIFCHKTIISLFKRQCSEYVKHKYNKDLEDMINIQINDEFTAGYTYLNIATYFARSDVALPGLYGFFIKMFYEELGHGMEFIKYQTTRGGKVVLGPIEYDIPKKFDIPIIFACALEMEKNIKEKLQKIHLAAGEKDDTDVQNFLDNHIEHQEKSIQEMARYYTRATLLGKDATGKYLFDRELHETHVKKDPAKVDPEIGSKYYS